MKRKKTHTCPYCHICKKKIENDETYWWSDMGEHVCLKCEDNN